MRPDRLVVGEVREAESLDLLIALNSGLPGMCSIHANSARDALSKLSTLPLLAGRNIDSSFVVPTVASSIDIVVHCELARNGVRRVVEILATSGQVTGSLIEASTIFTVQRGVLAATGSYPTKTAKFRARDGLSRSCRNPVLAAVDVARSERHDYPDRLRLLGLGLLLTVVPVALARAIALATARSSGLASLLARPARPGGHALGLCRRVRSWCRLSSAARSAARWSSPLVPVVALAARRRDRGGCPPARRRQLAGGVAAPLRIGWCGRMSSTIWSPRCVPGWPCPTASSRSRQRGRPSHEGVPSRLRAQYRRTGNFALCLDELKGALADPIADRILETLRMSREVGGSELTTVLRSLAAYLRQDAAIRSEVEARQSWVMNAAKLGVSAPWVILLLLATRPEAAAAYNTAAGVGLIVGGLVVSVVAYRLMLGHRADAGRAPVVPVTTLAAWAASADSRSASGSGPSPAWCRGSGDRAWSAGSRPISPMSRSGAREMLSRRTADPLPVMGMLSAPVFAKGRVVLGRILGGASDRRAPAAAVWFDSRRRSLSIAAASVGPGRRGRRGGCRARDRPARSRCHWRCTARRRARSRRRRRRAPGLPAAAGGARATGANLERAADHPRVPHPESLGR